MLSKNFVTDNNQDLVTVKGTIRKIRKLWEVERDNSLNGQKALNPDTYSTMDRE